ncbi:hypothetical protein BCT81_03640 [Vibrio sp. 10N.261.52.A1]|nr:hypothetical protein BCT81_03640 [Vibrio sp. 10N.261.52.A1]
MDISGEHPLIYIESTRSLETLLVDRDLDGIHLFCGFNYKELSPKVIKELQGSRLQSISFNDSKTIYPALSKSHKGL